MTAICDQKGETDAAAPTVATLTAVATSRLLGLWELEWSLATHHADKNSHLQMENLLLLPLAPHHPISARTRVKLETMHCMVEGVSWDGSHCSQGSIELSLGVKPTCRVVF